MKAEDLYHRQIALLRQKSNWGSISSRQQDEQLHRTRTDTSVNSMVNPNKTRTGARFNRKASLSESERVFLSALLLDNTFAQNATASVKGKEGNHPVTAQGSISDDILFSVPAPLLSEPDLRSSAASDSRLSSVAPGDESGAESGRGASAKHHRNKSGSSALHVGLWRAHEDGVPSAVLLEVNQKLLRASGTKEKSPSASQIPQTVFHDSIDEHIGEIINTTHGMTLNDDDAKAATVTKSLRSTLPHEARNQLVDEPALREEDEDNANAAEAMMALASEKHVPGLTPLLPEKEVAETMMDSLEFSAVFIENEPTTIPSDAKREGLLPDGTDLITEAESCRAQLSHMDESESIRSDDVPLVIIENEPLTIPSDTKRLGLTPEGADFGAQSCVAQMSHADEADSICSDEPPLQVNGVIIENEPLTIPSDTKRLGLTPEGADLGAQSCVAQMSHADEADSICSDEPPLQINAVIIENEPLTIPSDAKRVGLTPDGTDLITEAESCRAQLSHADEADSICSDGPPLEVTGVIIENEPLTIPSDAKREGLSPEGADLGAESCVAQMSHADEADTIRSDGEVRRSNLKGIASADDGSNNSSWGEHEGGFEHYDAWQVLKDEYAHDFGFSYREDSADHNGQDDKAKGIQLQLQRERNNNDEHVFKILGTSANDRSAQPQVMSPPLLESLMSFVPDHLSSQNMWLKYSLVRDGASIYSLRDHCKKSQHTFMALETKQGDVLGSFTSTPWHQTTSYYGTGESFLWKMRHSRMTKVHSLLEQAELESEVDIFPFSGLNYYIQLCNTDKLAVGGGSLVPPEATTKEADGFDVLPAKALERLTCVTSDDDFGFGIAINGDMSFGTTSPCATFRNPSLVNHSSKTENFEIVNLEVWTFTPCETIDAATQVENMKYDRAVSYRATGSLTSSSDHGYDSSASTQSIADLLRANQGSGVSHR